MRAEDDARVGGRCLSAEDERGERQQRDRPGRDVADALDDRAGQLGEMEQGRMEAVVVGVHDVARPPPVPREDVIEREPEHRGRHGRDDRERARGERGLRQPRTTLITASPHASGRSVPAMASMPAQAVVPMPAAAAPTTSAAYGTLESPSGPPRQSTGRQKVKSAASGAAG